MRRVGRTQSLLGLLVCAAVLASAMIACGPMAYRLNDLEYPVQDDAQYIKAPVPPMKPEETLASIESIVDTPPFANIHSTRAVPLKLRRGATVGVLDFTSSNTAGSGTLAADTFSIYFSKASLRPVEREHIRRILDEQKMSAGKMHNLSDIEVAKIVGKMTRADYMVFGAVTQYSFYNDKLEIPYIIRDEEMAKYMDEIGYYMEKRERFEAEQTERDEQFFKYAQELIMARMMQNDADNLTSLSVVQNFGGKWEYNGAQMLDGATTRTFDPYYGIQQPTAGVIFWQFDYFNSRKVLPLLGVRKEKREYVIDNLEEEVKAWRSSFSNHLKKHDATVQPKQVRESYASYKKYLKAKKDGEAYTDENIEQLRRFSASIVLRLRDYFELVKKIKANKQEPIPVKESQFQLKAPERRLADVANVGLTFKIIETRTGDIVWIGQTSKRDVDLQKGLNTLVDDTVAAVVE